MDNNKQTSLLKLEQHVATRLDLAEAIIKVMLCVNDVKLSPSKITMLAYFMIYGINASSKELIVKSRVCKNLANVKTMMVELKKLGLIYKDEFNGKVYIVNTLNFELTPTVGVYIKMENKA